MNGEFAQCSGSTGWDDLPGLSPEPLSKSLAAESPWQKYDEMVGHLLDARAREDKAVMDLAESLAKMAAAKESMRDSEEWPLIIIGPSEEYATRIGPQELDPIANLKGLPWRKIATCLALGAGWILAGWFFVRG